MNSPRQGISDLPEICYRHGMRTVVISPGSRNAPLIFTFTRHAQLECLSITDERSAAYVALGIALQTRQPVGLVCTSGTAALNYAPAIAEAYYQNIPLVVITADRPAEWIDQADGQTIRQSEIYRNYSPKRSCQIEILDNYEHKHQLLTQEDGTGGLKRMSQDIILSLLRKLAILGVNVTSDSFRVLKATYYRSALDMIEIYHHDAVMNGLTFDQNIEEIAVEFFTQSILEAGQAFIDRPNDQPFIPSWNRVQSAFPNIFEEIYQAVEQDNLGSI